MFSGNIESSFSINFIESKSCLTELLIFCASSGVNPGISYPFKYHIRVLIACSFVNPGTVDSAPKSIPIFLISFLSTFKFSKAFCLAPSNAIIPSDNGL